MSHTRRVAILCIVLSLPTLSGCATVARVWAYLFPSSSNQGEATEREPRVSLKQPEALSSAAASGAQPSTLADGTSTPPSDPALVLKNGPPPAPAPKIATPLAPAPKIATPPSPAPKIATPTAPSPKVATPPNPLATKACQQELDEILAEYVAKKTTFKPSCASFTSNRGSKYYTYKELTVYRLKGENQDRNFPWAILSDAMLAGADYLHVELNHPKIASGYRTPTRQLQVSTAGVNSRHILGDAVDFAPPSGRTPITNEEFTRLRELGFRQCACVESNGDTKGTHMHFDWRGDKKGPFQSVCPSRYAPAEGKWGANC